MLRGFFVPSSHKNYKTHLQELSLQNELTTPQQAQTNCGIKPFLENSGLFSALKIMSDKKTNTSKVTS